MKFSQNSLNEIQARAAEVFSHYGVALQKGGKSYLGLCPFHQDHKPSFAVRLDGPKAGQWKCFACGAKGRDIFSFVAQMEGLNTDSDFPEVVRRAAAACGLSYLIGAEQSDFPKFPQFPKLHQTAPNCTKPPRYFNAEADAMASEVEETNLFRYLCGLWDAAEVRKVMEAYKVGRGHFISSPRSKGNETDDWSLQPQPLRIQDTTAATSFPSIDAAGNVHSVKIIPYPETDHHRIKGRRGADIYWIKPQQNPGTYFGTHLLQLNAADPVAIVESEKSAIIGTLFAPEYIWLATAGVTNLNAKHPGLKALEGRTLHLFPDADKLKEWRCAAADLRAAGFNVEFRDEVIRLFPAEAKCDIADLMIKEKEYEKEWE